MPKAHQFYRFYQRVLPYPILSLLLAMIWLAIQGGFTPWNLLFAILFALCLPLLLFKFLPLRNHQPIHILASIRLIWIVIYDIVVSSFRVAKLILFSAKKLQSEWINVPLSSHNDYVNTFLMLIITTTPGTISVDLDTEKQILLVHCLHTTNIQDEIEGIKQRYEQPLMKIFSVQIQEAESC